MKAPHSKIAISDPTALRLEWTFTGDELAPYRTVVNGHDWVVRVNNFPDEHLYTLVIDRRDVQHLDEWPAMWVRPR